jgi:hypothetical protein
MKGVMISASSSSVLPRWRVRFGSVMVLGNAPAPPWLCYLFHIMRLL